tara:strand:- start:7477 stop:7980 length:504 start_codon:yes stop_codon:yes gene_type:complete
MPNSNHASLTSDDDLHEVKGASAAALNNLLVFDGAGGSTTQKVALANLASNAVKGATNILTFEFRDVSTARSAFVIAPFAGTISKIWSVLEDTLASVDCIFTFELGGTAVTNSSITIGFSGSAAGDVDSATPTALNIVTAGQPIEIISNGASTNAKAATFTFEIVPS